jgi:hypothetical protein
MPTRIPVFVPPPILYEARDSVVASQEMLKLMAASPKTIIG